MRSCSVLILLLLLAAGSWRTAATDRTIPSAAPAQLKPSQTSVIRKIKLQPESITLQDGRDARKVLVYGETDAKTSVDLTGLAVLRPDSSNIEIDSQGYIRASSKGQTSVTVSAAGRQAKLMVKVESAAIPEVRFVRDIEPILSKVGCNAGTCHGS